MSNPWIYVLLAFLATARLTRLVTGDFITQPIRSWVHRRFGTDSKLGYLVTCDWCVSIYTGTVVAVIMFNWWYLATVQVIVLILAASHFTGLLTRLEAAATED